MLGKERSEHLCAVQCEMVVHERRETPIYAASNVSLRKSRDT